MIKADIDHFSMIPKPNLKKPIISFVQNRSEETLELSIDFLC